MKIISSIVAFLLSVSATMVCADSSINHPFYAGFSSGYGSSTWSGLIPAHHNKNAATALSTPIKVHEGGMLWGFFSGYEFNPYFALEIAYTHYPHANVAFDAMSLFAFDHDNRLSFNTTTQSVTGMAKIMLNIPRTSLRAFSSFGVADIYRKDEIIARWHPSPTFGAGLIADFTPHLMGELSAYYTAGYGESELNPVDDYIPFLYAVSCRLAYRF